jgi:hypothetical protein
MEKPSIQATTFILNCSVNDGYKNTKNRYMTLIVSRIHRPKSVVYPSSLREVDCVLTFVSPYTAQRKMDAT